MLFRTISAKAVVFSKILSRVEYQKRAFPGLNEVCRDGVCWELAAFLRTKNEEEVGQGQVLKETEFLGPVPMSQLYIITFACEGIEFYTLFLFYASKRKDCGPPFT
jgi:hypothetical protein